MKDEQKQFEEEFMKEFKKAFQGLSPELIEHWKKHLESA
jgi:hypothetical protein